MAGTGEATAWIGLRRRNLLLEARLLQEKENLTAGPVDRLSIAGIGGLDRRNVEVCDFPARGKMGKMKILGLYVCMRVCWLFANVR